MKTGRYDFNKKGKQFIFLIAGLALTLQATYVILKLIFPIETLSESRKSELIQVDARGYLKTLNEEQLNWYLGGDSTERTLQEIYENEALVKTTVGEVLQLLKQLDSEINESYESERAEASTQILAGEYADAVESLEFVIQNELSDDTRESLSPALETDIMSKTRLLAELKTTQKDLVDGISVTKGLAIFWSSPTGLIVEIFFWSVFGVLTNLMLNAARFLNRDNFCPRENWTGLTKIIYTPIISFVLVFAFMAGFIDFGDYQVRAFSIPIIAFILGYSVRKTVSLLDKLSERILGNAEKSIEEGPEAIAERQAQQIRRYAPPQNLIELKENAIDFSKEKVRELVQVKERKV